MIKKCRICGSESISDGFNFQPYTDFITTVYDCYACGCRFTKRDEYIYEKLHSEHSTYSFHYDLMSEAKDLFDHKDLLGLENFLCSTKKNQFIIDHIKNTDGCEKILEFGCSRGYLSSYSILKNKEFYGVDISDSAIKDACSSFGPHFYGPEYINELPRDYFDLIYHVGTIGCVDDPLNFISSQLKLLKPGGSLIFNAPNLAVCNILNLEWLTGTTPPDLVTLFPTDFWKIKYTHMAEVDITIEHDSPLASYLRRKRSRLSSIRKKALFSESIDKPESSRLNQIVKLQLKRLCKFLPPVGPFSPLPQEFGVLVKLTKK